MVSPRNCIYFALQSKFPTLITSHELGVSARKLQLGVSARLEKKVRVRYADKQFQKFKLKIFLFFRPLIPKMNGIRYTILDNVLRFQGVSYILCKLRSFLCQPQ